eukprot:TRINITY_DN14154_c1_g3_i1.p1 TRINITY_DN14154_c1_g3~~TRINITY_DN14154_c1_g3_i1.p1  ORF type:complete len:2535 (+),score=382.87 TRINITY_DN14154_c1_g3_i1:627-7607(+)
MDDLFEERERDSIFKQLLESNADEKIGFGPSAGFVRLQQSGLVKFARLGKPSAGSVASPYYNDGPSYDGVRLCDLVAEVASGLNAKDARDAVKHAITTLPNLNVQNIAEVVCRVLPTGRGYKRADQYLASGLMGGAVDVWVADRLSAPLEEGSGVSTSIAILDAVKEAAPGTKWADVFDFIFDLPDLQVLSGSGVNTLIETYASLRGNDKAVFPFSAVLRLRKNTAAQLRFLEHVAACDEHSVDFAAFDTLIEPAVEMTASDDQSSNCWMYRKFIEVLLELADIENYGVIRGLFEKPLHSYPEALLVSLCSVEDRSRGALKAELMSSLVPLVFDCESASSARVQEALAKHVPMQLRRLLHCMYEKNPRNNLPRIIDIISKEPLAGFYSMLLNASPTELSCQIALHMSQRGAFELQPWLKGLLSDHKDAGALGLVRFLRVRLSKSSQQKEDLSGAPQAATWPAGLDQSSTVQAFFASLQEALPCLSPESARKIRELKTLASQTYPALKIEEKKEEPTPPPAQAPPPPNAPPPGPPPAPPPQPHVNGKDDLSNGDANAERLETFANHYFRQMYRGELSVQQLIDILTTFRAEGVDSWNYEVYSRMLQSLFDECRFFSRYPAEDLLITGELFGSLINNDLVETQHQITAFRCFLESLRRPVHSKMFDFGITCLEQFLGKLPMLPQLCNHITQIENMNEHYPTYVEYARQILQILPPEYHRSALLKPEIIQEYQMPAAPRKIGISSSENAPAKASASKPPPQEPPPPKSGPPAGMPPRPPPASHLALDAAVPPPSVAPPARPADAPPSRNAAKSESAGARAKAVAGPTPAVHGVHEAAQPKSTAPASSASAATQPPGGGALMLGGTQAVDQLLNDPELQMEKPPAWFTDMTAMIFNSLSADNLEAKVQQLKSNMAPEHYHWLAYYAVKNRASKEVNHHPLYIDFFERFKLPKLMEVVTATSYDCLRVLLKSVDQAVVSTSHRTGLKNLGYWLGQLTLARNKPLKSKHMDLKPLLIDAFENGRLTAVLPLVCKILEGIQKSKVFKPPNPWTMAVMSLLAEIHDVPNLRTNLMFEVEVLCKHLDIKLAEVERSSILVGRSPPHGSPDLTAARQQQPAETAPDNGRSRADGSAGRAAAADSTATRGAQLRSEAAPFATDPVQYQSDQLARGARPGVVPNVNGPSSIAHGVGIPPSQDVVFVVSNLADLVKINPTITMYRRVLQSLVPHAVDRAIKEVIAGVVERCSDIACLATVEVVTKDYAVEPDEKIVRSGAELMAKCLASSLALATCDAPLKAALTTHLWSMMVAQYTEQYLLENPNTARIVDTLIDENLRLCISIIEKATLERVGKDISRAVAPLINARQEHRVRNPGKPFVDNSYVQTSSRWPGMLPEMLKLKPGSLSALQQKCYFDFGPLQQEAGHDLSNLGALNYPNAEVVTECKSYVSSSQIVAGPLPGVGGGVFSTSPPAGNDAIAPSHSQFGATNGSGTWDRLSQAAKSVVGSILVAQQQVIQDLKDDVPLLPPIDCATSSNLFKVDDAMDACQALALLPLDSPLVQLLMDAPKQIAQCQHVDVCTLELARRIFASLVGTPHTSLHLHRPDTISPLHITLEVSFALLDRFRREHFTNSLTGWLDISEVAQRYNVDLFAGLLRYNLLVIPEVDRMLARWILESRSQDATGFKNSVAVDFVVTLLQRVCLKQRILTKDCFPITIESLRAENQRFRQTASSQVSPQERGLADAATKVIEELFSVTVDLLPFDRHRQTLSGRLEQRAKEKELKRSQGREDRPSEDAYRKIFEEWRSSFGGAADGSGGGGGQACAAVLQRITASGLVANEEAAERFFLFCCECAVQQAVLVDPRAQIAQSEDAESDDMHLIMNYSGVDAFARLVVLLMKCGDKVQMLTYALSAVVKALLKEADDNDGIVNQKPYFRLLNNILTDVTSPDPNFEQVHLQLLGAVANALHMCSPLRVPCFAFHWLELASHRLFVPKLLKARGQRGWLMFQRLIVQLLCFLEPYLRNVELDEATRLLYKGTVRVLLVLLHDFPEFLCDYHFVFCDIIPVPCVQIRNLILSAFPRAMRLPDPFMPNLKVDLLPEIRVAPKILASYTSTLQQQYLKADVDNYMRTRDRQLLDVIKDKLRLPKASWGTMGTRCNVPLLNALLLYVGVHLPQHGRSPVQQGNMPQNNPSLEIFMHLAHNLDPESRYLFLSAIANHLRFPNTHTHYFSCVLLYVFAEATDEAVREQTTRVLLERLIVHRPHPWGLLITFVELIKNRRYTFWSRSFVTCAPEVEKLFQSVALTCLGSTERQGTVAGAGGVEDVGGVAGLAAFAAGAP